jgi:hypothetical protein
MSPSQSPHRQRVSFWVASLVFGVVVFSIIGSDGYFANPETRMFAAAVALVAWAAGVALLRAYIYGARKEASGTGVDRAS